MECLWPDITEQSIEKNQSLSILREQANYIKKATKNKIRATFSKVSYKSGPLTASKQLGQMIDAMTSPMFEEEVEEELKTKKNINDLFSNIKYKFEIYNDEYRYRLFVLNYSELFPVSLDVDGGILEEISYKNTTKIESNNELKEILKEIFGCSKVQIVISRMLQEE